MADIVYQFSDVPVNPASHCARLATVYPLAGKRACGDDRDTMLRAGLGIHLDWKKRLVSLQEAGWGILVDKPVKLQQFRNCPPSVYITEGDGRTPQFCRHPEICPWCYARWVKDIFAVLTSVITPRDRVVWTVGRQMVAWEKNIANSLARARKTVLKLVNANLADCRGLHWSITAEPYSYRGAKKLRISYRIIALLKPGQRFEFIPSKWYGQTLTKLHKMKLPRALSRVLRYPEYLFRGEPNDTVVILNARRGLRLTECYGCLRTPATNEEKGGTDEKADSPATADCP